jgi:hypothetical protein
VQVSSAKEAEKRWISSSVEGIAGKSSERESAKEGPERGKLKNLHC